MNCYKLLTIGFVSVLMVGTINCVTRRTNSRITSPGNVVTSQENAPTLSDNHGSVPDAGFVSQDRDASSYLAHGGVSISAFRNNYASWLTSTDLSRIFQLGSVTTDAEGGVGIEVHASVELSQAMLAALPCSSVMEIYDAAGSSWTSEGFIERLSIRASSMLDIPIQRVHMRVSLHAITADTETCQFDENGSSCHANSSCLSMQNRHVTLAGLIISDTPHASGQIQTVTEVAFRTAILRSAQSLVRSSRSANVVVVDRGPNFVAIQITGRGIVTGNDFEEIEIYLTLQPRQTDTQVFCAIDGDWGASIAGTGRPADMVSMEPRYSRNLGQFCTRLIIEADENLRGPH